MFQHDSLRASHARLLPQSPKDSSVRLCLFCSLAYRVIIIKDFTDSIKDANDRILTTMRLKNDKGKD